MTSTMYRIAYGFEATKSALSMQPDPEFFEAWHVFVHVRNAYDYAFDARAAVHEYVAFLGLPTDGVRRLRPVFAEQAETACMNVAEFGAALSGRAMAHSTAAAFAAAWIAQFDACTMYFLNTWAIVDSPPDRTWGNEGCDFFGLVHEAGVLAVSPTRAGLFWSAEDD